MSKRLLVRLIRLVMAESGDTARVPNQLMLPDEVSHSTAADDEEVTEFSGAGAVAGYSAPLGVDPDRLGRKKDASKRR